MNSELPLTRRDVVALVTYAALGYNVLNSLLHLLCQFLLPRISYFHSSLANINLQYYSVSLGITFVFVLACLPFVSLVASGVAGRNSSQTVTRRNVFWLTLSCMGLMMFLTSFPTFALYVYLAISSSSSRGSSFSTVRGFYLQYAVSMLVCVSIGFALAFFPAIFGALRARHEESASSVNYVVNSQDDEF